MGVQFILDQLREVGVETCWQLVNTHAGCGYEGNLTSLCKFITL